MLLTIDVGNTNTVLGVFNGDVLEHSWRVKTDPRDTADELWLQYSSLVEGFSITGIAICSTVPAVLREVRKLVNDHYSDIKSVIIEPGVKTGVPLLVDNPKEIGADRIVNTLAASTLYGNTGPAIVVDFGTSTNLDVVSPKGEFLGGALAPGIEISVEALAELEDLYPDAGEVSVIATGGLAPLVLGISETIEFHEPDLTLIGLRLVHERN